MPHALVSRRRLFPVLGAILLLLPSVCSAQSDAGGVQGIDSGNYNIQQTIEFGYRQDWLNGNNATYDTFVNLGSGLRLFDYTLDMRSLNHDGLLFDNLHFINFGYGGDPNDASRLHIDKNKWYDFDLLFRRDKNYWDWNLWANPFNPISTNPAVSPTTPVTSSPHSLDLVRRTQDYNLTLFPHSRVSFRLGYSRNRNQGPGFFTMDGGTISAFHQTYNYTTNAYRAGVDFRILPRTTLSYDQFLSYFKQDNVVTDNFAATPGNFSYQLADGTPVDLGLIWANSGGEILPCAAPITNGATTPPTVTSNCNGYISYSQSGRLRNFMPTERFRFQSNYFNSLELSGSFGYSTADSIINNYNQSDIGWTTRTSSPGGTTAGPADAKRVSVDANWDTTYAITGKLRVVDSFRYENWRIPGVWNSVLGTYFNTIAGAAGELGAPVGFFVPANCNTSNSFNGTTCPGHTATSAADIVEAYNSNFLKQDLKSNTFQIEYDFSPRYTARIGYLYSHREIVSSATKFTTQEIFFPGGTTGTSANDFLAARDVCAPTGSGTPPLLPAGCVYNADGTVTYTPAAPTTPVTYDSLGINENALLLGVVARPADTLRITGDVVLGYNDHSFTRVSPRQVQTYRVNVNYTPKPWADLTGAIDIGENRDNVYTVNNLEHDRMYSFATVLSPNSSLSVDFGYNYWDVYSQAGICYTVGFGPPPAGSTPCPTPSSTVPLGALAVYTSSDHFAYAGMMWKVTSRVIANLGFNGSFVRGTSPYFNQPQFATATPSTALEQVTLNPFTPSGTLAFNYLQPTGSITVVIYKGLSYKTSWNYYGYNNKGYPDPAALAPIPLPDFNGSNATFSIRYAF
jgi:hypothetical protein